VRTRRADEHVLDGDDRFATDVQREVLLPQGVQRLDRGGALNRVLHRADCGVGLPCDYGVHGRSHGCHGEELRVRPPGGGCHLRIGAAGTQGRETHQTSSAGGSGAVTIARRESSASRGTTAMISWPGYSTVSPVGVCAPSRPTTIVIRTPEGN